MKNTSISIRALVVAFFVGAMAYVTPMAQAAPAPLLTAGQQAALKAHNSVDALIGEAKKLIDAAPSVDKQRLAEEITAWVAANKPGLKLAFASALIAAYPALNAGPINLAAGITTTSTVAGGQKASDSGNPKTTSQP